MSVNLLVHSETVYLERVMPDNGCCLSLQFFPAFAMVVWLEQDRRTALLLAIALPKAENFAVVFDNGPDLTGRKALEFLRRELEKEKADCSIHNE